MYGSMHNQNRQQRFRKQLRLDQLEARLCPTQFFAIDANTSQRSVVRYLTATFDGNVTLSSSAIEVKHGNGTLVAVSLSSTYANGKTTYTAQFSGMTSPTGSLPDDAYTVTLHRDGVSGVTMADDVVESFHCQFGDADGNATVNTYDLNQFRNSFLLGASLEFDSNLDNQVSQVDFSALQLRYGTSILLAPEYDLAGAFAIDSLNPHSTTYGQVTLIGKTSPLATVRVLGTELKATAATDGSFQIPNVSLPMGDSSMTLRATSPNGASTIDFSRTLHRLASGGTGPTALTYSGIVPEGSSGQVYFTGSLVGQSGYTYSFDFGGDGTFEIVDSSSPTATVPASYFPDGPKSIAIAGKIKNPSGQYTAYSVSVPVKNVAPTLQASAPSSASVGTAIQFQGSASDPGPLDLAAGFTYLWSFGDGTTSTQVSPIHTYATAGQYSATFKATDKDSGYTITTLNITVSSGNPTTPGSVVITPHDRIPNFGFTPTVAATASGSWSNPSTWSTGQVPGVGEIVSIGSGFVVTYDVLSNQAVKTVAIQSGGSLRFRPDIDTRLTVVNLLVMEGGELQIGTTAIAVAATVKAEVIFADVPLDLVNDPQQYGNGLIALGRVTVYGSVVSDTFVRLATEPVIGATTLYLSVPVTGWKSGDRLVLPDTRQLAPNQRWTQYTSQLETPTISSISADGLTITLSQPLLYNHLGARNPDGVIEYRPHVGLLSHNVAFRSQNNFGTRGYTLFTHRAEVDIHNAAFQGLGRTTNNADDNTTYDVSGQVTHLGTNQAGRYPVYFDHLLGLETGSPTGYQYTFTDNAVTCQMNPQPYRWGITLDGSSYGLIQNNVVYNWAGAGVAAIGGDETANVLSHNFVVGVKGDDNPRNNSGRDASGFWFVGFNNCFRDNVVADAVCTLQGIVAGVGYNLYSPAAASANTRIPLYRGADSSIAGQYQIVNKMQQPIAEFTRNEAYGACATGLTLWNLGTNANANVTIAQSVIKDFLAWNVWEEGFFGYPIHNVLFDGFTVIGDPTLAANGGGMGWSTGDYWASDITIRRADVHGMNRGIGGVYNSPGTLRIENSTLRNYREEIWIPSQATYGGPVAIKYPRTIVIDNVRFVTYPGAPAKDFIALNFSSTQHGADYVQHDQAYVYNFNGVAGDNFQLYYLEQAASYVVPQTTYYGPDANGDGIGDWIDQKGSLVAGMTNAQTWAAYGIAIAGEIAPTSQTRPSVHGFVRPF